MPVSVGLDHGIAWCLQVIDDDMGSLEQPPPVSSIQPAAGDGDGNDSASAAAVEVIAADSRPFTVCNSAPTPCLWQMAAAAAAAAAAADPMQDRQGQ